jgi:hypothetical protein
MNATTSSRVLPSVRRNPPLTPELITARLRVDIVTGHAYWRDASKFQASRLNGKEAGSVRVTTGGAPYWLIEINGVRYRRSAIVFAVAHGRWPELQIDHKNRDSLDDRAENLREATCAQNIWNQAPRAKASSLPRGVRRMKSKFQARINAHKVAHVLGTFDTQKARAELFGDFA